MKSILVLSAVLLYCLQTASAIQMILATRDPNCVIIVPFKMSQQVVDIKYSVSGVNESNVVFTVS